MDPREIALDSAPECRRIASRRMVSVVRSAHLENAVTEPPSTLEEEAPAAVARIDRTLRNFVPRCGPTRSAEHRGNEHAIIPRAPIGVPLESAATFGTALTPQQHQHRQERARLENSRVKKWLSMLARPRENPRNKDLLKKRCRKGIPDSIRGTAWFYLVDGAQLRAAHEKEFTYDDLLGLQV